MEETSKSIIKQNHERHFSTNGSILLPLVLKWRLLGFLVSVVIAAFMIPCVIDNTASAAEIELTVPKTLSLSVSPDGQFHSQQSDVIEIKSDAYAGYTFTLKGSDNTKQLKSGNEVINSITTELDETTYKGTDNLNTWGYLPSKLDSIANMQYQPGPTTTPVTIEKTTVANSITANKYTITLGVKVNSSVPAGTYGNTFILMVTANDVPYTITYNGNGEDAITPAQMKGTGAEGDPITISAAATRQGYEFKGWCDKQTSDETCSGTTYQPNDTYKLQNSANNVTLYAMWVQDTACVIGGQRVTEITDPRDGNIYRVRKLKDGKCWMIDNLRLGDNKLINRTLTSDNTNINGTYTLPDSNADGFSSGQTQNLYVDEERYGGYYSWCAAVAGTCSDATKTDGAKAPGSICPKGWRLPTSSETEAFASVYSGDAREFIDYDGPNLIKAGYYYYSDSKLKSRGVSGGYWTSIAKNEYSARIMYFVGDSIFGGDDTDPKGSGFSVRCVAE